MFDLVLCLSDSVNVREDLHTHTPLGLYNKILVGYLLIYRYFYLYSKVIISCYSPPPPFLPYLIKSYPSDDEQRELQY
jgi:hypothetical protein